MRSLTPIRSDTILDRIFAHKQEEVAAQMRRQPLSIVRSKAEARSPGRDFLAALRQPPGAGPALIAEVKHASPSKGVLAADFQPLHLARLYQRNGAAAISVLTDERFFQGHLDYLNKIAADVQVGLPALRKDFLFDPYQLYQARSAGADAVLLIVACLDALLLADLQRLSEELGMAALVEVHDRRELDIALRSGATLVGVNNRDLHDFSVDLGATLALRPHIPPQVCLVSESGIHSRDDVERLAAANVDAILVGEALVVAADRAGKVRELACYG